MRLRLPHVLFLMALVLLSGVVSARLWEARVGGAIVPGVVLVDEPTLGESDVGRLLRRWPDAVVERVPVGAAVLAPFGPAERELRARRGDTTALFTVDPSIPQRGWDFVHDRAMLGGDSPERAMSAAADFLGTLRSVRPFVVAVALGPAGVPDVGAAIEPLVAAADALPGFRRTSVVVLGALRAHEQGWTRTVVRIDRGRWGGQRRAALADLRLGGE